MADAAQRGGGGDGAQWQAEVDPNIRRRVLDKIVRKMAESLGCQLTASQDLHSIAAKFEAMVFSDSNSVQEYLGTLSRKMSGLQQRQRVPVAQAAPDLQQQVHMGREMQPTNAVRAILEGNSSVASMRPAASTMAVPRRPPYQLQNMHIRVKQDQAGTSAPMALAVQLQPGQRTHCPVSQLQHTTFAGCNPTSAPWLRGQPCVRPNAQQNHLLRQNATGIITQQPQSTRMNHQDFRVNQQQIGMQRYQTHGAHQANVALTHISHSGGQNNQQSAGLTSVSQAPLKAREQVGALIRGPIKIESQPLTPPQQQITISQQSNLPCQSSQTSAKMGTTGEVDWREQMFQKISSLKDEYFLELTELDQTLSLKKITKEQLESLPKEQADRYMFALNIKSTTRKALNFLQLQKSNIPEGMKQQFGKKLTTLHKLVHFHRNRKSRIAGMDAGHQSRNCREREPPRTNHQTGDTAPSTGGTSREEKQQEQPAGDSISQLTQNIASETPFAPQQNHSYHLVGQADEDEAHSVAETPAPKKKPIDRLVEAVRSSSPAALRSFANSIGLKRGFDHATSCCGAPSSGSMDGSCVSFERDAWEYKSSGESGSKKQRTHNGNDGAVLDEIRAANSMLIDTVISITDDDNGADGTMIKFSYSAVSLAPSLKPVLAASEMSIDMPVKLLVPNDYPRSSPMLIDDEGDDQQRKLCEISGAVDVAFRRVLRNLPEPRSIKGMAMAWDSCMRMIIVEFAHRHGGGMFSSKYGHWESCASA